MRFGFVTGVQLGLGCLEEIYDVGGDVDFVMTLRDDIAREKSGRVYLDDFAARHGVPLHKIRNINDSEALDRIREAELDWLFIIGWSQIARSDALSSPNHGCLGMHPTLLPEGRGRASIPWAIIKGLKETGVTMFRLDEGVDTGPVLSQERIPIQDNESATSLYGKVATAHRRLMRSTYPTLRSSVPTFAPQDESLATAWQGRSPADGLIRESMTMAEIDRLVRATTHPYPGAYVVAADGVATTVWSGTPTPIPGAIPIVAADGTYWAIDTSIRC